MQSNPGTTASVQTLDLDITGMSCGHCVAAVREALTQLPGVEVQRVAVGQASVTVDTRTTPTESVLEAVRDAGYDAALAERPAR
jgi:copper chaperone